MIQQLIAFTNYFTGLRINDSCRDGASKQALTEILTGNIIFLTDPDAVFSTAINFIDNDILSNINKTAGQIACICSTQGCIGKTFTCTMCRNKVFKCSQTFAEV
ncbi:MAG: hypothetical protein ACD_34C00633G0002 [uncultured bacterium]|nr:MAG: hypothetical protein ACD_34C00633G0002 [uncultured bacterium]